MKNLKYIHKPLFFLSVILFGLGLVMVFSASSITTYMSQQVEPYYYFMRQSIFLAISLILFLIIINVSTKKRFFDFVFYFMYIVVLFMLIYVLVAGNYKNNAKSWIDFGFFSLQPSEVAKVVCIVILSCFYFNKFKRVNNKKNNIFMDTFSNFIVPFIPIFFVAFLIYKQPDLGTCIIFTLLSGFIFLKSPVKLKTKLFSVSIICLVGICLLLYSNISGKPLINDRQKSRFDYNNPCSNLLTNGNQVCNGYIAINNGGLTGVGLGKSTQKYLYLPEPYTDFIFAIIVEELGVIVGIMILFIYILVLVMILTVGKNANTSKGALICYGVCFYIFLHIIINLFGILGLMPMTGVPLPFMSYGGTFTICLAVALSLVQRIHIESRK